MKPISPKDFRVLLEAAIILSQIQTHSDPMSIDIAYNLWRYIDACREKYPALKDIHASYL